MKVKVTKVMVRAINDFLKEQKTRAVLEELTLNVFTAYVDYNAIQHCEDYDEEKGVFKVIKILYPDEYYANPMYLTTKDLERIYHDSDKTYTGFFEKVLANIEV